MARRSRRRRGAGRKKKTVSTRRKEDPADYRYLDEFDLPPLSITEEDLREATAALPGVPLDVHLRSADHARVAAVMEQHGLSEADATLVLSDTVAERFFTEAVAMGADPRAMCLLVQSEVLRRQNDAGMGLLTPSHLVAVHRLLAGGRINRDSARIVLDVLSSAGGQAEDVVVAQGLGQTGDEAMLRRQFDEILREHPRQLARYQAGFTGLLGFFVGKLMAVSARKADPVLVNRVVRAALDASRPPPGAPALESGTRSGTGSG